MTDIEVNSTKLADPASIARQLADLFENADLPYALGGALAYGFYGMPRATGDVDFNVFIQADPDALDPLHDLLDQFGAKFNRQEARQSAVERGDFRAYYQDMRLDFFVLSIPLSTSAANRVKNYPLLGRPIYVLSPEDLILFKLLFFRGRDELDIRRMVATLGESLDVAYVDQWLADMVGAEDARMAFWHDVLAKNRIIP